MPTFLLEFIPAQSDNSRLSYVAAGDLGLRDSQVPLTLSDNTVRLSR